MEDLSIGSLKSAQARLEMQGLESRPAQNEMMQVVEAAIEQKSIAVIESGTGVGKSLGYLVPALLAAKEGQVIVIATATVNLQQQLIDNDIPQAKQALKRDVSVQLAKGRGRYLCPSRLNQQWNNQQWSLDLQGTAEAANYDAPLSGADAKAIDALYDHYHQSTWDGDLDQLDQRRFPLSLWPKISNDSLGCTQSKCSMVRECPYFIQKRKLQKAQVIITNHDLLLADLKLGSGVLLPPMDKAIVIVDEAHQLPEKAVNSFAQSVSFGYYQDSIVRLGRILNPLRSITQLDQTAIESCMQGIEPLQNKWLAMISEALSQAMPGHHADDTLLLDPMPKVLHNFSKPMKALATQIYTGLSRLRESVLDAKLPETDSERLVNALAGHMQLHERWRLIWQGWAQEKNVYFPPSACWLTRQVQFHGKKRQYAYRLHCSPTSAQAFLPGAWWLKRSNGIVLCSATLRSLGNFDYSLKRLALTQQGDVSTHYIPSPLPYDQSGFWVPPMQHRPSGKDQSAHRQEVIALMPKFLKGVDAGTLVLFTSKSMLEETYDALDPIWQDCILSQAQYARGHIVEEHKRRVESGERSVIFGLESFAQGVDLPGRLCQQVIITKLPFTVPTDPIDQVYCKWLDSTGQKSFLLHSLANTSLRLVQYVGRLVRSDSDRGRVILLDRRVIDQFYGRQLLDALPPFAQHLEQMPV